MHPLSPHRQGRGMQQCLGQCDTPPQISRSGSIRVLPLLCIFDWHVLTLLGTPVLDLPPPPPTI